MKVSVEINFESIRILFGEIVYLYIKRDEFVGFQSWEVGNQKWCIEFYTKTTQILTEQNSREKWIQIIKALDEKLNEHA